MKASPSQTSFNAGEWSSRLDGRFDLAKYANACRRMRNFLPSVQGPAIKRSGTRYVKDVKTAANITRLIPFEFGTTQAYVLELGNLYCRVYRDSGGVLEGTFAITSVGATTPIRITTTLAHGYATGNQVFVASSAVPGINSGYFHITVIGADTFDLVGTTSLGAGGAAGTVARVYEFATPYTSAELASIQIAQSADVLYLACPTQAPHKIGRTDHTAWTITEIFYDVPPFSVENLDKNDFIVATEDTGVVNLYSTNGHFVANHVGSFVKLAETLEGNYPEWAPNADPNPSGPTVGNFNTYRIGGSIFTAGDNIHSYYAGRLYKVADTHGASSSGTAPPVHEDGIQTDGSYSWTFVNHGYGWVEITSIVDAYKANGTVRRNLGRVVRDVEKSILSITHIAGTLEFQSTAHGYRVGEVIFVHGTLLGIANNLKHTVTAITANTFSAALAGASVAVGAGGTCIRVKGDILTGSTGRRRLPQCTRWAFSAFSAENGYPTTVGFFEDRLWWAGTSSDPQGLWGSRVSRYEDHLSTDEDDGALFLLLNTQQVNRIEWLSSGSKLTVGTAGGEFVIEAAPAGPLTAGSAVARQQTYFGARTGVAPVRIESVTMFVQRSGRKLIEFAYDEPSLQYQGQDLGVLAHHLMIPKIAGMAWAQEPDRVLWVHFEDGSLAGFTYDRGQDVVAWHPHMIGGASVSVESIAVIPHPNGNRSQVWMIVKRTVNGSVVRHVEFFEETWIKGSGASDAFFVDAGLTYDGAPTTSIVGLWHLLGTAVDVLADGVEVTGLSVHATLGTLTLPAPASVVHVGLGYDAELEPMLLEAGGADGTAQGKTKRVTNIVLRLEDTGPGLTYGVAEDQLAVTAGTLVTDDTEILPWPDGYTKRQRLPIKHKSPTPCTLVAMFPQVHTEDR